ncbi:LytTR family DNA-binding domain-containing protein [Dysgonomonas sp. ZJ709]|uniref:LytR/AlgR family response regulator transcription factor n=1 Tax=Dysgonomonas sp. ZJ709 TaxID=2709797 RepID=UPI0013E9BFC1|nr:LytTR family DNA-binding domain-containing protein [Dysgonomonas sp. ZJ709]
MKVLIVEDETAAYESLVEILKDIDPSIQVVGNAESVSQTIQWLNSHPEPDLILMDIHLSDGSSFLIFDVIEVETPIIFTTAYDEYAIEAFKLNSVDYLLKPIKSEELERALNKFKKWTRSEVVEYLSRLTQLAPTSRYKDKFLIPIKDKLLPINLREVSYFYTTDKSTHIYLKNGQSYPYSKTLEQIFLSLNPADFYRANKQFIIARESIKDITIWFDNRLLVTLDIDVPERIYVSKNKAADFKAWIVNE